jgi:hypothetical protein
MAGITVSSNFEQETEGSLNRSFESGFFSSHCRGFSISSWMRVAQGDAREVRQLPPGPGFPKEGPLRANASVEACRTCHLTNYHILPVK